MNGFGRKLTLLALLLALWPPRVIAQESNTIDLQAVCARVDDEIIRYADIVRERKKRIAVKSIGDAELAIVDAHLREQLIERKLALAALVRMGKAASKEDVDFELGRWKEELKQQGETLAAYLAKESMTEAEFRRELLWRVSWNRFLADYLTEANLEKFFKDHAADYDGRKVRVSQILLKVGAKANEEEKQAAINKAKMIREEIATGKVKFGEAAKAHSQAPSAKEGGEQGWIERREPMGEEFSKAAFALSTGGTSEPVVSSFGVHLIHCLEIAPGRKGWKDARRELERDVTAYLGRWLVGQQRDRSHVERTEVLPLVESKALSSTKDVPTK